MKERGTQQRGIREKIERNREIFREQKGIERDSENREEYREQKRNKKERNKEIDEEENRGTIKQRFREATGWVICRGGSCSQEMSA